MTDLLSMFTLMNMCQLNTPSLWKHISNGIAFALVVDDFGIKSTSPTATTHLLQALRDKYKITTDPDGTKYLGFTLKWDYIHHKVWLSMPQYVTKALHRLQHNLPLRPHHDPHSYNKPNYGQKVQFATPTDPVSSSLLHFTAKKIIQKIIGIFLYYGIAMDLTMLVALGTLASQQETPTEAL